jgi:hypothetical protein
MNTLGYDMNDKNRPPIVKINPTNRASVIEALVVLMALIIESSNIKLSQVP